MTAVTITAADRAAWSVALDDLEGIPRGRAAVRAEAVRRWRTPGELAQELVPTTVQTAMLDELDEAIVQADAGTYRRWIINTPPQEGKALALDTPLATPTGWTTMGTIRVGDQVFDRYGKPCTVTYCSPVQFGKICYVVRTGDGEAITADAEHRWVARLDRRWNEHVHTTAVLASSRSKNAQIEGPADLALPSGDLPLDPYVLGAWLGDGHSKGAAITTTDPEILDRIRSAGIEVRSSSNPLTWRLGAAYPERGRSRSSRGEFRDLLVAVGVWDNKHIPVSYLRGSAQQRLALLQGLIDTDGYVHPKGQVEFTTTLRCLAEDVRHLVFTLGAKATVREGRATIDGRDCGPKYRVKFYLADAAHLPRKAGRCRGSSVATIRYVWAEPTLSVPVKCIEVDSDTHTYLAGRSLLPTHNSSRICRDASLWLLLRNPNRRIVIASYQQTLAEVPTLDVRQLIEKFGTRFGHPDEDDRLGLSIDPARGAMGNWRLAGHRGGMVAAGVGSGITGKPGDVIVVDDPLADAEAADSPTMRAKVIAWWTSVIQTRLVASSIVIVVQTRWNEEDLSGWLISNDNPADPYYQVLSIPAQAEADDLLGRQPGEWLTSARERTTDEWEKTKREVTKGGIRWWFALYQQRPAPPSGDTFKLDWFDRDRVWQRPSGPPPTVVIDPADNTGTGDEAGIIVASVDSEQRIYLGPDYSGHYTTARWVRLALLAVVRHHGGGLAYEKSLSGLQRSIRDGWNALYKQARILRRLAKSAEVDQPGPIDPDVIEQATTELCHPDDSDTTWQQVRNEMMELWPLADGVLAFPDTGPIVRRIIPRGTKSWRAQAASPKYEHRLVSHVGNLADLEHQMSTWQPGQKSPDRMDAAVHAVLLLSGASVASLAAPSGSVPTRSTRRGTSMVIPRSTRR